MKTRYKILFLAAAIPFCILALILIVNQFSPLLKNQFVTITPEKGITCSTVSEDGKWVAVDSDGKISILNATNGNQQNTISDIYSYPASGCIWMNLSFSPDGTLLAAASEKSVRVWNVESGVLVNKIMVATKYPNLGDQAEILQTIISPNNQFLVVVFTHFVEIYTINDSSLFTTIDSGSHDPADHLYRFARFSPLGDFLLVATTQASDFIVYDFPYLQPQNWTISASDKIYFAPDQKTVIYLEDNHIALHGDKKYEKIMLPADSLGSISAVNFLNNSDEIIFANQKGSNQWEIFHWNIETGEHATIVTTPSLPEGSNCEFSYNLSTIIWYPFSWSKKCGDLIL